MNNHINPYLNDRNKFAELMCDAGIMIELAKGDKYSFDDEQALKYYDENVALDHMRWFDKSEIKRYRLRILFLMGIIASQKRNYERGLPRAEGDNVIDFLEYKKFRYCAEHTPLTIGSWAR